MKVINIHLPIVVILCLFSIVACVETVNTPAIKYEGQQPQTPESILEAFKDISITGKAKPSTERVKMLMDQLYPPIEWLQILLDKGVIVEDSDDFREYMKIRKYMDVEKYMGVDKTNPVTWRLYGQQYNDWETYLSAIIDRKIWEYKQLKAAIQQNSNVWWVDFLGEDGKTVIPITNSSKYVKVKIKRRKGMGVGYSFTGGGVSQLSEQQKFDLVYKGKQKRSWGWTWGFGWKIIYLDEDNNVLSGKPEPISREDLNLPDDVPWPPKNQEHLDRIIEEVKLRNIGENR